MPRTIKLTGKSALAAMLYSQVHLHGYNDLSESERVEFTFEIKGKMPSLNEYDSQHSHYRVAAQMKKHWTELIAVQAGIAAQGRKYLAITVDIQWIEPNKRRDKDNIAFAKKFIFDGLVLAEIIPNDGWANVVNWTESFKVDTKNPRVLVTVMQA